MHQKKITASNIIETYKTIAEKVIAYDDDEKKKKTPEDVMASRCIKAAREHLNFTSETPGKDDTAVFTSFPTTHGYSGCVVWLNNLDDAKRVAQELIDAFLLLHQSWKKFDL